MIKILIPKKQIGKILGSSLQLVLLDYGVMINEDLIENIDVIEDCLVVEIEEKEKPETSSKLSQ